MVLIFGWGRGRAQDRGEVAPLACPNCHNEVFLHEVESKKQVSLYFIPVVGYGSDEYLLCPVCGHGLQILPVHRAAVDEMRATTARFRHYGMTEDVYRAEVARFWGRMGLQGALPPTSPTVAPPQKPDMSEQLLGLAKLHAEGVLTDEEFTAAKRRVLEG
jgi:uncharacterized protein YbaR (Trm112 family)